MKGSALDSPLPIETVLRADPPRQPAAGEPIGQSREGRPIFAWNLGRGPLAVSLIGGCHADEPVGPAMLHRLVRFLAGRGPQEPSLGEYRWLIVPHVNPDGEARNRKWSEQTLESRDHAGSADACYDVARYVREVVRELPGDDVEFGFPRDQTDVEARPENRAVADLLSAHGPFHLHASFHGMGFAPGPWFLIEPSWIDRTIDMRRVLRQQVTDMHYPLFDVDRRGEKGFHRIDEGFCTRPDSAAMAAHFRALGDDQTAGLFRPSSMEFVRSLGGDPLTMVSEMPLFLLPAQPDGPGKTFFRAGTEGRLGLHRELARLARAGSLEAARHDIAQLGIRAMPIRDQMRLQLAFLNQALRCVESQP